MKEQSQKTSITKALGISSRFIVSVLFFLLLSGIFLGLLVKNSNSVKKKTPINKTEETETNIQNVFENSDIPSVVKSVDQISEISEDVDIVPVTTVFDENKLPFLEKITGPVIAIVIDDMGVDLIHSQQILKLDNIYTVSYLTYAPNLQSQIDFARSKGKEVMLHIPMESVHKIFDYGPEVLLTTNSRAENLKLLNSMLDRVSGYIGINNHMGSKFTADLPLLSSVIEELSNRGLMFLDSKTTPKSQTDKIVEYIKLPVASRDVFIDDSNKMDEIEKSLYKAETIAKKRGYSVAIAHPRPNTIKAFNAWLPTLKSKGIKIVPISYIIDNFNK